MLCQLPDTAASCALSRSAHPPGPPAAHYLHSAHSPRRMQRVGLKTGSHRLGETALPPGTRAPPHRRLGGLDLQSTAQVSSLTSSRMLVTGVGLAVQLVCVLLSM